MLPVGIIALGLVQGALAAIDALGLVLLFRTTRIVNLAQPSLGLVGGVLTGLLVTAGKWSFWWAAPVGIVVGAALGLATDRVVLRRLHDAPRAVVLVATVGLAQIFTAIAIAIPFAFSGPLPTYTISLGFTVDLFPVRLLGPHLLVLLVLPIAWYGAYYFLHRSRFGLAALALGQEAERARAIGVPAAAVRAVVWAVAGVLATLGGILSIPVLGFNLGGGLGPVVLLLALTPAVLAGFRSLNVAVLGALGMGVAYQAALWYAPRAGIADLLLAGAVIVAVGIQRGRLGREEAAARASSWEAAATPRPLRRVVAEAPAVRIAGGVLLAILVVAVVAPPMFLSPSGDVAYATAAAFAVAALGVAVAWMFAGEVSLGHWGLAGFGAVIASLTPGPWVFRTLVSTVLLAASGAALALASRRRSTLSFAVISLGAAATAPVAVIRVVGRTVNASPGSVGSVSAAIGVAAAIGIILVRRSNMGARMIAARDDPQRAPWLGADLVSTRVIALTISAALAGLAGGLYFASTTVGLTTQSFEAGRSLDLLSVTVIGGLGSPFGALAGAAVMRAGRILLPGTWASILSGAGVLLVVLFLPAGLSRGLIRLRDWGIRLLVREPAEPQRDEVAA